MSFVRFEHLLERTMGLSTSTIGASAVERAVRARLRACDLDDADAYWEQILRNPEQLQELIEAVVVPETWFFRDPQAFRAMARIATQEWLPGHPAGTLRLLSLPCSTGEEPYTMAMALMDAGLPASRFRIDAIDISGRAIAHAQRGIYGRNSFRSSDLDFRDRYFAPAERGWRIGESARASVRLMQGNMFDADFLRGEVYDIVFCRNLLIYFDAETQGRAVGVLQRLLVPQGTLFVGHSEAGLMQGSDLGSAKIPMAFAFRRSAATPPPKPNPASKPPRAAVRPAPKAPPRPRPATPATAPAPGPDIGALRAIANRGQFAEAAAGCERHMRQHGASPEAFLLLGLISDASGDLSAAAGHYRKALYLQPDHAEALGHLALLLSKQGDAAGARLLNERMRRAAARGEG